MQFRCRLWDGLAIIAACGFVLLAAYRIELPGLYMDELDFANAAQGAPDDTMIRMRVGAVPLLIMPYLGALKGWLYAPVFALFGVSALTVRLPAILLAAVTLLIFYHLLRAKLGAKWAATTVAIMAVDPANLFPSRLDWGPTVLMHFFQASILAIWFSYRDKPQVWKLALILVCFALGFFDKFNFIWMIAAFIVGICLCYPDDLKKLWVSYPPFARRIAVVIFLIVAGTTLYLVLPFLLHFQPARPHTMSLQAKWNGLLSTLSGVAVAHFIFGSSNGMISFMPFWLIVIDCCLALSCLFFPTRNPEAQESRKNGFFFLILGFLIFLQIAVTPQAGGPHHYSMVFPLPLLAFVFLAKSVCSSLATVRLRRFAALLFGSAAVCLFVVNLHNTAGYVSHFRTNPHYNPRWSPAIYSLSGYINAHGFEVNTVISVDWGLHNQLHALAPRKLRSRMRDYWPVFREWGTRNRDRQDAMLRYIFREGKSFVLTFAPSKETFPEARQNFFDALATHPELKSRLVEEFWFGGEKIYQVYEIWRGADMAQTRCYKSLLDTVAVATAPQ
jgi:dolichyl-phosphate-mannose-protein mannosyltransferase